jgi:hypothetical protein
MIRAGDHGVPVVGLMAARKPAGEITPEGKSAE